MLLGRKQALMMKYVDFLQIQVSTVNMKPEKTIKAVQEEQVKVATEPVRPVIQQSTGSSITINGKTHQLPTTNRCLLKEYADVFEGIGTHLCGEYHIQLKEDYKPVQDPPLQVAVSLKPAYRAQLDGLPKLCAITEVREYTEWVKLNCSCKDTRWFPEVMPGSKGSQQEQQKNLVIQQDNWWHSTSSARLHTPHPARFQAWVLALPHCTEKAS